MQVTQTLNEGLKRGYDIKVSASDLQVKVDEKLEVARRDFQMKGFRKGKAPAALMKKMFGKSVLGEAVQETIDGAMREHFDKSGERPALQPEVKVTNEDWKEGEDMLVSMTYEALPVVPEVDFAKVKLERLVVEPDDAVIGEALDNLAKSANNFEPRKKGAKAKEGDQVVIDFKGTLDGVAFDGGTAEDYPLVLGSNSFIPGFEAQLTGAKAGDEVDVKVTFPENYGAKNLSGKDAVFACVVKSVSEPVPAPIDDALAQRFGAEDLAALKTQVSTRLAEEYSAAARQVQKRKLMDALDKLVSFELPASLVKAEADQVAHQLWHEEHPEEAGHSHDTIEATAEHMTLAERRVRLGLLLAEVGTKAEITVTEAEMQQAVMRQARQYRGQERQYIEFLQKNPAAQQQLRAPIFEDKVVDHILGLAKVAEKKVTKAQLEKAVEALETE